MPNGRLALLLVLCSCSSEAATPPCASTRLELWRIGADGEPLTGTVCIPRTPSLSADGHASCVVVEARASGDACDCAGDGRSPLQPELDRHAREDAPHITDVRPCLCELEQYAGSDLQQCQSSPSALENPGWCYVDATVVPPLGNPALTAACSPTRRRGLRVSNLHASSPGAAVLLICDTTDECAPP